MMKAIGKFMVDHPTATRMMAPFTVTGERLVRAGFSLTVGTVQTIAGIVMTALSALATLLTAGQVKLARQATIYSAQFTMGGIDSALFWTYAMVTSIPSVIGEVENDPKNYGQMMITRAEDEERRKQRQSSFYEL